MSPKPTTAAARLALLETALQALQERVARLEAAPEPKPAAAVEGPVRCAGCGHVIPAELLARDPAFFGISVSTNAAGATVTHCSPTCSAPERSPR